MTATVVGLTLLLALVVGTLLPNRMDALARAGLDQRGSAIVQVIAASLGPALDFDDSAYAMEQLEHLQGTADAQWAALWRADGTRLAAWGPAPEDVSTSMVQSTASVAIFVQPVRLPAGPPGRLAVGLSMEELLAKKRSNQITITLLAALLVVIGALGASLIGSHLARPVRRVTHAARRVADGEREIDKLGLDPHEAWRHDADESRQLTLAVSDMARQLTQQLQQIEQEWGRALEAERAALEASRTKSAFLANMSHELRTPLNAVLGYAEMLIEDARIAKLEDYEKDLERITFAGGHLLGLINDLLDLAKIEAGSMTLSLEAVEVAEVVSEVTRMVGPLVAKNGNVMSVDVPTTLGPIRTDAQRLRQILFNLLGNAAKFTHAGHLVLRIRAAGDDVSFEVEDDGIGIDPSQIDRLFGPFQQEDASTTKRYGGTGLGLTLVRHFTEMLGGEVAVRSTPGVGSVFAVTLRGCRIGGGAGACHDTPVSATHLPRAQTAK